VAAPAWGDIALGLSVVLLALILGWQTSQIPLNAIYAKVGPNIIPWMVTGMLGLLGIALTFQGIAGGWAHEQEHGEFDWPSLGWLLAGLFANAALIEMAGFIISSTLLFVFTARAFKSNRPVRDAAIGFTLAIVAYVGFDRVLGYKIGEGLIERFI
jgi:putative tricarboxylic transport membrane protein